MPNGVDFERIRSILAGPAAASLPSALRAKMQHDLADYDRQKLMAVRPDDTAAQARPVNAPAQVDISIRPDATAVTSPAQQIQQHQRAQQVAQQQGGTEGLLQAIPETVFQLAHDMSLGVVSSPYSNDPTVMGGTTKALEPVIKIGSGITSMVLQGGGLLKGLSYAGKVPLITRGLEFMPTRLKEIGVGALLNGGLDALRADGLSRDANGQVSDQSWLDLSAKMAAPLVEIGVPERIALGMGGAAVGALIGPIMIGVASGFQAGRASFAAARMTPEMEVSIRDGLKAAGVDLGVNATKYDAAKAFIKNFRKISMRGEEGGVIADQLSREQYLANEVTQAIEKDPVEHVVANAVRDEHGVVHAGRLDYQAWESVQKSGATVKDVGFVTNKGRFVDPKEAEALARDTGQLEPGTKFDIENLGNPQVEMDGRLMAGIFRTNPEGINIVRGVSAAASRSVKVAQDRLGLTLHTVTLPQADGTVDVMLARPNFQYPSVAEKGAISNVGKKVTDRMRQMAKEASTSVTAPRSTEAYILADGEPIRGGLNMNAMIEKMKLQKPVIAGKERPDLALREAGRFVRLDMPEPNKLVIELPRTLTQEQFNAVGRAADAVKFEEITIRTVDGAEEVLKTPIGGLVQDRVAKLVKPSKVGSTITPKMIDQFRRTGVFEGQAVVLPDGTAGRLIHKQGAAGYLVEESLTNQRMVVHPKNLTILPTTLNSELQPSNLFTSYMPDAERAALAKLRYSIQQGWANPIKKFRDFEAFANTRGYIANSMRGGKIELTKLNEGGAEAIKFESLPAAVEWVRKDSGPMAELAPDNVERLLGPDRNLGFIGGGGAPPRPNELMPIDWERMNQTMSTLPTDRAVGFFEEIRKPMIPLLRSLDERYGTQMFKAAYNMQSQQIARQNFDALWFSGRGKLPNGVKPLEQIIKSAGKNADRELIFDWREADAAGKVAIEKRMAPQELGAAKDLANWFDHMYSAIGVDAPFVENYMPRYREWLQKGGSDFATFLKTNGIDPLKPPKGVEFISDHLREGLLDVYEKDAFKVAVQYLRMGSKNRFLKQAQDGAREMVRMVAAKNPNLAHPLGNMLQAMGGYEFSEQRAMLNETFQSFLDHFPGQGNATSKNLLADRLVNFFSGAVYSSTMGFRPSLALRNASSLFVMAYPLYGGPRFYEAIGRSLSAAGRDEAMAARALGQKGGMLTETVEEFGSQLPPVLRKLTDASTKLYEDADTFTRAATYHAAKFKAEDALAKFAKSVEGVSDPRKLAGLKADLLRDAKVYIHGREIEDEFLRRAGTSPESAAQFAGKVASDMTNFLYGRGMQARWMRSTAGRFLGQFGSWSMWYMDYLGRLTRAAAKGPNRGDALAMLGRHALVNAAIVATGKKVLDVDLSRWASYGAVFYSGGPGWSIATGASTLMRGLGEQSTLGEDRLASARVTEGAQEIWNVMPSFVPFMFAGKDVLRMAHAYDGTELLAATLGVQPTRDYIRRRQLGILLGDYIPAFQTTSTALSAQLNARANPGMPVQPVDIRTLPRGGVLSAGEMQVPSGAGVRPGQHSSGSPGANLPALATLPTNTPATSAYRRSGGESRGPTEPKPPGGY